MKYIALLMLMLSMTLLTAVPTYYPTTTLVEDFAAIWCVTCLDGINGIDVLHNHYHNGEMISVRYYTTSGDLSNPEVDDRFEQYQVFGVPAVFFNGKFRVDGGGTDIADGSTYLEKIKTYIHHGAPLKIDINGWQADLGRLTGTVTMVSPNQNVDNQKLQFLLLEDNVETNATHVVRSISSVPITINGVGSTFDFDHIFTINPTWNIANLWAAVFVQMDDDTILQTAHTLAPPEVNLRAAMDWDNYIVGITNTNYLSQPFYFFNLGVAQDYTMQIVVDDAPDDWFFNYCDEEGYCYPGSVSLPMNLAAGEIRPYHLNLMIGNTGTGYFHWEVTSPSLGTYIIPFRYRTNDVAADDNSIIAPAILLGKNYPNPFRGNTTIPVYSEKQNASATIEVYNLKGQKVMQQKLENLSQGTNQTQLNLSNFSDLSSGVYYYRLKDDVRSTPRKMLFIR